MNSQERKQQFKTVRKGKNGIFIVAAVLLVGIAFGVTFFLQKEGKAELELYNVGAVSYEGKTIQMTELENSVEDGKIVIPLQKVKESSIIYTEYIKADKIVPLTAFITPTGNVIAAVSMCEPCRGTRFHLKGQELVCNACGTRWTLDGLKGTWGGCLKYPPEALSYEIDQSGTKIILDELEVASWVPRKL